MPFTAIHYTFDFLRSTRTILKSQKTLLYPELFYISQPGELFYTSQPGPGTARKKLNAFFVKQSFFSNYLFRFWSLGYPRVRVWIGSVRLVLRTFPEAVWRSEQNLVDIGMAVRTSKREIARNSLF